MLADTTRYSCANQVWPKNQTLIGLTYCFFSLSNHSPPQAVWKGDRSLSRKIGSIAGIDSSSSSMEAPHLDIPDQHPTLLLQRCLDLQHHLQCASEGTNSSSSEAQSYSLRISADVHTTTTVTAAVDVTDDLLPAPPLTSASSPGTMRKKRVAPTPLPPNAPPPSTSQSSFPVKQNASELKKASEGKL
uniref:Par3_HAL_N_term domain-containing protein n=1 Tax=Mesocestoides corti TaxID=53468 RepID=A0A5K3F5L9_MESCO